MIEAKQHVEELRILFDERTYVLKPEVLYGIVKPLVASILDGGTKPGDTPEAKRLASLVRLGVKGVLTIYGRQILDELYHSKEHPTPAKGDDLIAWYTNIFTLFACAETTKHTLEIDSKAVGDGSIREITQMASIANITYESQNAAGRNGTNSVSLSSVSAGE
jgi:hypothetical protein